jgi:nitronate monooxygenase
MLTTRFTELVGCAAPIQQAGMSLLANPRLAAAVTNAGGLGMVSVDGSAPAEVAAMLDQTRTLTSGAIGANFLLPDVDPPEALAQSLALAAARARVIDFFYANPDPAWVDIAHAGGALACWQVGSLAEAVAAAKAGCDLIVVQGIEAGGHIRGHSGLFPLLSAVLEAVDVPVLAAGGIGTGRAMAAALAAGAAGVRVGTRFVAAEEAGAHPKYVQALIAAGAEDTVFTQAFAGGWAQVGRPDAPHRVLRSSLEAAMAFQGLTVGQRYDEGSGRWVPVRRLSAAMPTAQTTGAIEAMALYAGESVGGVKSVQPAGEIVRELTAEAEQLLQRSG